MKDWNYPSRKEVIKCNLNVIVHLKRELFFKGMLPLGGGEVVFKCPVRKHLRPVQLTDSGMVKRIRGTAYALRISPAIANRMVESAKRVLLNFIPDVYINTDQRKGKQTGKSPGFGINLVAETTNGTIFSAERASYTSFRRFCCT